MLRVGVTRNAEQLGSLTKRAADQGIEIVPLPLFSIHDVSFKWPPAKEKAVDWIAFSSPQGVDSFFRGLDRSGTHVSEQVKMAAIGGKTAAELSRLGIKTAFMPSKSYGRTLFEEMLGGVIHSGETLVYARGKDISFDPAEIMMKSDIIYHPVICYRTEEVKVDPKLAESFEGGDTVLFTAPSAVQAYHRQFGSPRARALAIGETTAGEMDKLDWPRHETMLMPDVDTVLEYV